MGNSHRMMMDREARLKRLRFRAWHRGIKEADLLVGGFFDRHGPACSEVDLDWFERILEEQDLDIIAWATGTASPPARYQGAMMHRLQTLDYIKHPE